MEKFSDIDAWVFDLDNTLYPAQHNLFAEVDKRMTAFIQDACRYRARKPIACKKIICAITAPHWPVDEPAQYDARCIS